jgi:hypothetical protein
MTCSKSMAKNRRLKIRWLIKLTFSTIGQWWITRPTSTAGPVRVIVALTAADRNRGESVV